MNKKNKILVGCLALLLVLSVGYALFSETITINGTATAKGSFDITPTCQTGLSNDLLSILDPEGVATADYGQGGYKNDSCTATGSSVTSLVELEYPSAIRYFTVNFKNTGTIPAKLDMNKIVDSSNVCVKETADSEEECFNFSDIPAVKGSFYAYEFVGIKRASGTIITGESSEWSNYVTDNVITLNTNDTIIMFLFMRWDEESDAKNEYIKTNVKLDFNFDQITN